MSRTGPTLKIELATPASPAHVQDVARLCVEMLNAMIPPVDPEGGSVTLVVSNYDLKAEVRARDPIGAKAVRAMVGAIKDPVRTARASSEGANLAGVLARRLPALTKLGGAFKSRGRIIADCDPQLAKKAENATKRKEASRDAILNTGTTITPVLRMGRVSEDGDLSARLRFEDGWHDVVVPDEIAEAFWRAASTEREVVVTYRTEWVRGADGALHPNYRQSMAVGLDDRWSPAPETEQEQNDVETVISEDDLLRRLEDLEIEPWRP